MKNDERKKHFEFSLIVFVVSIVLIIAGGFLLDSGICLERQRVVLKNADGENRYVKVEFLRNKEKFWYEDEGRTMGAQYDGCITNKRPYVEMCDWKVTVPVPGFNRIDANPWNGVFEEYGTSLTITQYHKGDTGNGELITSDFTVAPGGQKTFGCIMYTASSYDPEIHEIIFEYTPHVILGKIPFTWVVMGLFFALAISSLSIWVNTNIRRAEFDSRQKKNKEFIEHTLLLFANTIEAKDSYTKGHSLRVAMYSRELARRMGLSEADQENVYYSAILHDVGKIGIPDNILHKPGRLTDEERAVIQSHAEIGGDIMKNFPYIPDIETVVRHHHERYDGNGYPDKLAGGDIPLLARIICVADCFDAMTSNRCYRRKIDIGKVCIELRENSGTQFDPAIVPVMLEMISEGCAPVDLENGEAQNS